jgi:hypothetical protein
VSCQVAGWVRVFDIGFEWGGPCVFGDEWLLVFTTMLCLRVEVMSSNIAIVIMSFSILQGSLTVSMLGHLLKINFPRFQYM